MIATAMFEGFFLLPVTALGVIKDVGYRAGFLRDGLYGLQVLGTRSQGYRGEGGSRGQTRHTTASGLARNGMLASGMLIIIALVLTAIVLCALLLDTSDIRGLG